VLKPYKSNKKRYESRQVLITAIVAIAGGLIAVVAYSILIDNKEKEITARVEQPVAWWAWPGKIKSLILRLQQKSRSMLLSC